MSVREDAGAGLDSDRPARSELTRALAAFPDRFAEAAQAADAADERVGDWTARDVVLHLVAVDDGVHQSRLRDLQRGGDPHWQWTEPGPARAPAGASLEAAVELFRAARRATLEIVATFDDEGWRRSGTHATFGRLDVAGLLRVMIDHDEDHLAAMQAATAD